MRRVRASTLLALFVQASCQFVAGLDEKNFTEPSPSGGSAGSAGTSIEAGREAGGTSSGRGNAADGPGGNSSLGGNGAEGPGGSSSGGDTATGGRGGSGPAGGGEGGGTDDPDGCENVTEKLCMHTTWPDGVVPYVVDEKLPAFLEQLIENAIQPWEGMRIGSTALHFVRGRVPNVPTLVFSLETGCGPVHVTDDEVTLAFDSCTPIGIARGVGVALGLPRMHQRTDRARYLQMANRGEFDCKRGEIYDKCSNRSDIEALLGPFDFDTLMMAPGVDREECFVDPYFSFLYLPRGNFATPFFQCEWVDQESTATYRERASLAELYAIPHGWRPAEILAEDRGPNLPRVVELEPGVEHYGSFSVLRFDQGGMRVFSLGTPDNFDVAERHLWTVELDENAACGACLWEKLPLPPLPAYTGGFVAWLRPGAPRIVDFLYVTSIAEGTFEQAQELFHASYDIDTLRATGWTHLERPFENIVSYPMALAADATGKLLVYAHDANPPEPATTGFRTYLLEYDFESAAHWQLVPSLTTAEPLQTMSIQIAADEHRLVAATMDELVYASRPSNGDWSSWSVLIDGAVAPPSIEFRGVRFVFTENHPVALVGSGLGRTWFSACNEPRCNEPSAWSDPVVLGLPDQADQVFVDGLVSTDHHELGMIVASGGYHWFHACDHAPCDEPNAWSDPIVIGPTSEGAVAAIGSRETIDVFTINHENRPPDEWGLPSLWRKRWVSPEP